MRYASMFGIFSLFFLIFIVVIECPFYIKYNFFENKTIKINYIDIISGFKGDMKILQAISTLFYAFSCHVGVFPVLNSLKNPDKLRIKLLFKKSIALDIICYLIIGISGYLTQPENAPDLIIERKKIFKNDFLMIIGQICFIFTLIAKICANYNALRICIINLFGMNKSLNQNQNQISNRLNFILTSGCLIITTLIAINFQSISSYISLIGGFCSVIISVLIPGFIYIKGIYELKINNKTIFAGIIVTILTLMGFTNGILTIKKIISEEK
jgi:amino acid permease